MDIVEVIGWTVSAIGVAIFFLGVGTGWLIGRRR